MPRITLKETITKQIDIPMEALYELIDNLTQEEREKVMDKLKSDFFKLKTFKKDQIEVILSDFSNTGSYEDGFLKDLEEGLKKSSIYTK